MASMSKARQRYVLSTPTVRKTTSRGFAERHHPHSAIFGAAGEMVKNYQSHPSVLMWSIGNESVYGTNFAASYEWVKSYDPSRPVIFSYPGTVPDTVGRIYDILSMHYPPVSGNMTQMGVSVRGFGHSDFPTLHDEWAHPACYTYATLRDDPGIREFLGPIARQDVAGRDGQRWCPGRSHMGLCG